MKKAFILGLIFSMFVFGYLFTANAKQETCPEGNGWVKIDSGDLSLYPVNGAVEYCFKAGNWLDNQIPDGGFGQEGSCNNGIAYCELSHWSYKLGDNEPTPTEPEATPSATLTPTRTASPSATPTNAPTATPTNKPDDPKQDNIYKDEQGNLVDIGQPSNSGK